MVGGEVLAIFLLVSYGCVVSTALGSPPLKQQTPFSFDDIFDPAFSVRTFSPSWMPETEDFTYQSKDTEAVMRYNAATGRETELLDSFTFTRLDTEDYKISPDQKYALFAYEIDNQWGYSFCAKYQILDIDKKRLLNFPAGSLANKTLEFAGWSTSGNMLSFVYKNNLYYQTSPETSIVFQVTSDGHPMYIFNGVPDWLYEEDVLEDHVTHYWSPDNSYICYARINVTGVPLQSWPWYGPKTDIYGKIIQIAFPKAGDVRNGKPGPNSVATLFVVRTNGVTSPVKVPPPSILSSVDHYYLQVSWRDNNHLYVTWANRVQNHSISTITDVNATVLSPVINLDYKVTGGWIKVPPPTPLFIDKGARYLTVHPKHISDQLGDWRHLAVVTSPTKGPGSIIFLTDGTREVQNVVGYDDSRKVVYYQSTWGDPAERHIARVGLPEAAPADRPEVCLSCNYPETCRYVSASFSDSAKYYFSICNGPGVPTYTLKSTVVGEESRATVFENNDILQEHLSKKLLPTRQFITVPIGGGYTGRAQVFIPPNYVAGEKFPLLVVTYAGPDSQSVTKMYFMDDTNTNWLIYLTSSHRVVVASIDGRGTGAAGDKLKFEMYRKMRTIEITDQILGGSQLQQLNYVDKTKPSAIFGWSYGGGTTAHVMGNESQVFQCGLSVAPDTSEAYYDTAYTERHMGLATPDDNQKGYENSDVLRKAPNFKGKKFMISHGTADNNVHFMHAAQLIKALTNSDVIFKSNIYIDQDHYINSPSQSRHLHHSMTDFLLNDCWDLKSPLGSHPVYSTEPGLSSALFLTPATLALLTIWLSF